MSEKRGLPGGRGLPQGGDAFRDLGESLEGRRASVPRQDGGTVSVASPYLFNWTSAYTANTLYLLAIPSLTTDATVDAVRTRVVVADAGSTARVGIYVFSTTSGQRAFSLVPGTETGFSSAATGLITTLLPASATILANTRYFMGFRPTSATAQFTSIPSAATGALLNSLTVVTSSPTLPANLPFTALTASATDSVPGVVYLSRLWRDLI